MDLNASPEPEEDEVFPEPHSKEDNVQEEHIYNEHAEHGKSAVQISRQEREERIQRLKRQRNDDKPFYVSQLPPCDDGCQMKRQRPHNKLPPGWLDCPAFGQELNCIIPSKVPLGESFKDYILPGKRYSFRQVIHQQRVLGRKLGLVIDLTNSSRYYVVNDCRKEGIEHVKIPCKGHDSVPDNEAVNRFFYEVAQFLTRQKQSKKYILVHCTHGHNRTGYMIIHYLMRTQPISVTQAIKLFADARPPGIYKPDYIDALYNFYHENKPETVVCPPTPEWKRSSEFDLNGEAVPDDDDEGFAAPAHESHETQLVMTNDDILGDIIPVDRQETLRQFCYRSLKLPGVGLAEKVHHFTLLDGEMILDTLPDSQKKERRYLIYDMMTINQVSIVERPFNEHWKMLEKEVIEPWNTKRQNMYQTRNPCYRYDMEPFRVRRKDFWMLSAVMKLLTGFIPKLSHAADGLIFQMVDSRQSLYLYERGKKKLTDGNRVTFPDVSNPSIYSGNIIECSWNSEEDVWVCMKIPHLLSDPVMVLPKLKQVMRSINDNITEEILSNEINEIISLPIYADRIQSESKAHQHYNSSRRR